EPGVLINPILKPYKNCLIIISDNKDRIGYRAGKSYGGKVSRMKEELFYVEEHGRIIGDIAWTFSNYTSFIAYPAEESYLTIEGGAFYVSGDYSRDKKTRYVMNGFRISRSRTIIRNQWVGDRKSTRLNSSHVKISYAVFCLKKKKTFPHSKLHLLRCRKL